jgi:hypothetical protein
MVLLSAVSFSSCVSVTHPVIETLVNKEFPPDGRYEILGEANFGGTRYCVLGLFWWGGAEYLDLRDAAHHKFGYVDDVVGVTIDRETLSVLGLVWREHFILRGIAIRYIKPPVVSDNEIE